MPCAKKLKLIGKKQKKKLKKNIKSYGVKAGRTYKYP